MRGKHKNLDSHVSNKLNTRAYAVTGVRINVKTVRK
jgi:hypothetical protein